MLIRFMIKFDRFLIENDRFLGRHTALVRGRPFEESGSGDLKSLNRGNPFSAFLQTVCYAAIEQ